MFFPLLTTEEKMKCLSLLENIAKCDDDFSEKEHQLIAGYSFLMGLGSVEVLEESTDSLLSFFSQCSDIAKRAVFLESLGLMAADGVLHPEEIKIMDRMAEVLGFSNKYKEESVEWIKAILPLYYKGFELAGVPL